MPMLDVDESSIFFSVKGKGVPIVFIHPPVLTSLNFVYQVEELSRNFQVITFDIRGHGRSDYSNKPITYKLVADDIKHLLNHLQIEKAFICGYSTGASILLEFLLLYENLALGGIAISGLSEVSDSTLKKQLTLAINLAKAEAVSVLSWGISWTNSDTKKLFFKMFKDSKKGHPRNIQQYYEYCLSYSCTNQLDKIHLPILLIYGQKDKQFYHYAEILRKRLKCNELKFINNVSHQIPTKKANELNQLISQFIQNSENG
ncbi:alpha/beta fold hydrolase [Neobacillus terrae]|uniref:alpha/beta fold hydrolase n=1 Tax=Neobacillus terrae TaxID=3034837 RepID=UPI00140A2D52|nr:alpha/beta hydrolase [Neobacillus terrae]NHM32117.1 alpha/beta hydrolase [Neobacillus terrae]